MGRAKLPMKLIIDKKRRNATYRKRIEGLKKKAFELSTLCDVPVVLVSFGLDGQMHNWPEDLNEVLAIANRFQQLKKKNGKQCEASLSECLSAEINDQEIQMPLLLQCSTAETPMSASSDIFGEPYLQFDDILGGNFPSGEGCSNCKQVPGLMRINEDNLSNYWGASENNSTIDLTGFDLVHDLENASKFNNRISSSSMSLVNSVPGYAIQSAGSVDSITHKPCSTERTEFGIGTDDSLYEGFSLDDVDLSFENYEEFFGDSCNMSQLLEGDNMDGLFEMDRSAANSICQQSVFIDQEEFNKSMQASSNNVFSAAESFLMPNPWMYPDSNLCIPSRISSSNACCCCDSLEIL